MLRRNGRTAWTAAAAAGFAIAGVGVGLGGPAASAAAARTAPAPPGITWTACGDDGKAQCGTLTLPVDWDDPDGSTFELAVARRTALDPGARIGTLVFGPGGPGDSGVHRVRDGFGRFSEDVQRRFDIVSFDPRGVGASAPITCSAEIATARPSPIMTGRADFEATLAYNERAREDCIEHSGAIYNNADTLSTVKDVDAIRKALGESQLTFHGSSYGTLLGEQYAETYPGRVRAMVLESVVDHSRRNVRSFLTSQASTAQDSFDEFVEWCDRTADCALHGRDVRGIWQGLRERARQGDLPGLPEAGLVHVAFRALYGPDYRELAETIASLDAGEEPPANRGAGGPTVKDPFTGVFCSDWGLPVRDHRHWERLMRRVEKVAPDMSYTRPVQAVAACLGSPQPVANPQHRLRVRDLRTPILLSNAVHDPASGYDWATNVARQLGRDGVLLTYEGAGHGTYTRSDCVQETIDRYLIDLEVPERGTSCPAVPAT
ncbi:alpha/beta hydrolase [Actinomadura algeriensis]|uniref:Pimeloyl-ACP methyl ester carboxylesterase n=1 Tax=Actinomadura algeriensis TaxID=1679523 RepID=A0ABR9JMD5_9ACTN|nr:alpha/beta hydrolase [Actinomadura algeriensis]MBE1531726.1 pimeloyl-ACP methyl ester carboxylesterase [Actinomadura algeriensis]